MAVTSAQVVLVRFLDEHEWHELVESFWTWSAANPGVVPLEFYMDIVEKTILSREKSVAKVSADVSAGEAKIAECRARGGTPAMIAALEAMVVPSRQRLVRLREELAELRKVLDASRGPELPGIKSVKK